jgi:hypothetical protein
VIFREHHSDTLRRLTDWILADEDFYLFHGNYSWTRGVSGYVRGEFAEALYNESILHKHLKDACENNKTVWDHEIAAKVFEPVMA